MSKPLLVLAFLVPALLVSCQPDAVQEPNGDFPVEQALEAFSEQPGPKDELRRYKDNRSFKGLALPSWPDGWRVIERSRFASDDAPVVWFRLEAGDATPDQAVRQASEAIAQIAGVLLLDDQFAEQADADRAVAQVRGSRLTAVVEASREEDTTFVRVLLEPKPGFGS